MGNTRNITNLVNLHVDPYYVMYIASMLALYMGLIMLKFGVVSSESAQRTHRCFCTFKANIDSL